MRPETECVITAYPDGPYVVRGARRVVDADGNEFEITRPAVALCRCGLSGQKPWCDSTHKLARLRSQARRRHERELEHGREHEHEHEAD
ncbi:CDGSH iron-sulfur domain-containing protein [Streptomyces sp. CWNU-52B]|uniref:CDGSH iron-sulfur domain-containing protein n=1 Tax=unclassified Streptomyces TaxID=2593676 RepID=UPI0039C22E79